jgi:orotate phosphoribosyltransferase
MSDKSLRERLLSLIRERSFRQGTVTLSSGQTSDFYVDGKMIELMPEGAFLIGEAVFEEIKDLDVDAIGGLAVGAVPMVTSAVISCHHHGKSIEGFFVRAEAKGHGTRKVVEGLLPPKSKVVVVDDVITTGKSVLQAIAAVEEQGSSVALVLSVVDRQAGAEEFFRQKGYPYRCIFTKEQVMEGDHVAAR